MKHEHHRDRRASGGPVPPVAFNRGGEVGERCRMQLDRRNEGSAAHEGMQGRKMQLDRRSKGSAVDHPGKMEMKR